VKKTLLLAVTTAGVLSLCFLVLSATAQQSGPARQPGAPASGGFAGKTVLLDVNFVFKKHARFKAQMDQLKNDADALDAQMKKEEASLRNQAMGLQKLNAGSAEYKRLEEDIARSKTDWTIKVQQQRREFLMREAKIYNETYKEIEDEVNYFCQSQGILMVLRFMGDPVEDGNPDSILANINKPVVWYDKNLDITPYIYRRFAAAAGAQADQRNAPARGNVPSGYAPPRTSVPAFPANGIPR
jgi:Skp family chaperone for outer membrane proteins